MKKSQQSHKQLNEWLARSASLNNKNLVVYIPPVSRDRSEGIPWEMPGSSGQGVWLTFLGSGFTFLGS